MISLDIYGGLLGCGKTTVIRKMLETTYKGQKVAVIENEIGKVNLDQIRTAHVVYLNFTETLSQEQKQEVVEKLLTINPDLTIVDTPLAQLDENSFPSQEKEFFAGSSAKDRAVIRVEELQKDTVTKIYPKNVRQLYTWTYQFREPFTEKKFERLKELLADTEHCNLWRAKGILQMDNGTTKKIDITFGDFFEETRDVSEDERAGTLVLIGKRMDTQWLNSKFKTL